MKTHQKDRLERLKKSIDQNISYTKSSVFMNLAKLRAKIIFRLNWRIIQYKELAQRLGHVDEEFEERISKDLLIQNEK